LGEFVLALAEYETLTKRSFSTAEVRKILVAWLDWAPRGSRPLTLQTDEAALHHLQQNLHYNGQKGKVVALDIEQPKSEYRSELLKDLVSSKNQVMRCTSLTSASQQTYLQGAEGQGSGQRAEGKWSGCRKMEKLRGAGRFGVGLCRAVTI
jgi:hypothetical protein